MNGMPEIIVFVAILFATNTTTPNKEPIHKVSCAAFADAFFQKMPKRKTVVMGGAMCAMISLMPLKRLSYLFSKGNNAIETIKAMVAEMRPTLTNE